MNKPVCVVAGVGPGNGLALSQRFSQAGYRIAMLARDPNALEELAAQVPGAECFSCDLSEPNTIRATLSALNKQLGAPQTLIYNAGSGSFGTPLETTMEDFESAWRVNAQGLLVSAHCLAPAMIAAGGGNIIVSGATASLRGGAKFTAFAAAKAAQRSLAQSLARSLRPLGIHVALLIIDGVIDTPRTRRIFGDKPEAIYLQPGAIAEAAYQLCQQPASAWTFELDLRPSMETW